MEKMFKYRSGCIQLFPEDEPRSGQMMELVPSVYWLRMPLPMALNHINLYMIDEGDGWCVVDTGMHLPDSLKCWQDVLETYCHKKPIKRVIVTHMHPDHVGNAGWLCEHFSCPLLMSEAEYFAARSYSTATELGWQSEHFYRSVGLAQDYIDFLRARVGFGDIVSKMPSAYQRLQHGQYLRIGNFQWQVLIGRGHSLAHVSLYCSELSLLLAGDQLLPGISPNVSVMATEPDSSPLHDWFDSLKALEKLPVDTMVLPAHNKPFYGMHERTQGLVEHHEHQLNKLLKACESAQRPVDLLHCLFGREMSFMDMGLAIGECKAHLHMLCDRQKLERKIKGGVEYYQKL